MGIAAPDLPIAALHILMFAPEPATVSSEVIYANVRLHYRDGSQAVLPLRTQRELPGWTNHDRPVPFGWVYGQFLPRLGGQLQQLLSNPRLPNPHPERIIASIDLEASESRWSEPIFFAVTAEPVIAPDNSGIDSSNSSTRPAFDSRANN